MQRYGRGRVAVRGEAIVAALLTVLGTAAGLGVGPLAAAGGVLVLALSTVSLPAGLLASFTILYVVAGLAGDPLPALAAAGVGLMYIFGDRPGLGRDAARLVGLAVAFWGPTYLLVTAWTGSPGLGAARELGLLLGAERVLLAASSIYAAVIAYSVLHPEPGLPEPVEAWRRVSASKLLPLRAAYYGLGLYASAISPGVLVALMAGLGACLTVRMLTGRDSLGFLASAAVFYGLLYAMGLLDNFDAFYASTP